MEVEKIAKSSQEQAVGAWINYLNQVRLDRLVEALSKQNINLATAMKTIETAFDTIKEDIITRNRGGDKGMHGFIAEVAECGIGNARRQITGKEAVYKWINDNGFKVIEYTEKARKSRKEVIIVNYETEEVYD